MLSRRIKLIILLVVFVLSTVVTGFFIIKLSLKNHNLKTLNEEYDINIEPIDDKKNNLNPDVIFKTIDKKQLNKSIDIKLKIKSGTSQNPLELFYQPEYNSKLFEYIFLKNMIKTFPQWKTNSFIFSYDSWKQAVWVKYNTDQEEGYINWFFKIISKI